MQELVSGEVLRVLWSEVMLCLNPVSDLSHLEPEEVAQEVAADPELYSRDIVRELLYRFTSLLHEHSRLSCTIDDLTT